MEGPRQAARNQLLELNLGADLLEGSLDLGSFVLGDGFLDGLRSAFDEILGFLEAEARDRADFLDDFDLLVAGGGENDRELRLLFDDGGRASSRASNGDGSSVLSRLDDSLLSPAR